MPGALFAAGLVCGGASNCSTCACASRLIFVTRVATWDCVLAAIMLTAAVTRLISIRTYSTAQF